MIRINGTALVRDSADDTDRARFGDEAVLKEALHRIEQEARAEMAKFPVGHRLRMYFVLTKEIAPPEMPGQTST
jgi:hypothetical protein